MAVRAAVEQLDSGQRPGGVRLLRHQPDVGAVALVPDPDVGVRRLVESGETAAYSVHTAAQPPSAFIARWWACEYGFPIPNPVQWGTW